MPGAPPFDSSTRNEGRMFSVEFQPSCKVLPVAGTPWVQASDWECLGSTKENQTRATITAMGCECANNVILDVWTL